MISYRSRVLQVGVRVASPPALVIGFYLLFAGHNRPGGGFAAGLVFGAVIVLRTLAGIQRPKHGASLVAIGVVVATAVAAAPMVWGNIFLDQEVWTFDLPIFGEVKTGTAFMFDIGVTAIVVGLVIALLDGLSEGDDLEPRTGTS